MASEKQRSFHIAGGAKPCGGQAWPEELFPQKSSRLPPLSQCLRREMSKQGRAKPASQGHQKLSPSATPTRLYHKHCENTQLNTATVPELQLLSAWGHRWSGAGKNSSIRSLQNPSEHCGCLAACAALRQVPGTICQHARHDSPDPSGKRDRIPFCTRQLLLTHFLSHTYRKRATSQAIDLPTPPVGQGWNWSAALSTCLLDKFCQHLYLKSPRGRHLGLKQPEEHKKCS